MGQADDARLAEKDARAGRRGTRGSTNNAGRLAVFGSNRGSSKADWGGCDPGWLQAVVVGITRLGGAVTFGTSKDGGAYSLTLLLDGDRQTLWFNGNAELDAELENVYARLEALT